ncbi:MAG: hypothetical protein AB7I59_25605 [Geminicoccaceae bacterium]
MDLAPPDHRHLLDGSEGWRLSPDHRMLLAHAATSLPGAAELGRLHPANLRYDQRALLMAAPDDLVCVLGAVEPDYLGYLNALGLGPEARSLVTVAREEAQSLTAALLARQEALLPALASDRRPLLLAPFYAGAPELALARALADACGRPVRLQGDPEPVALANRKDEQRRWAITLGVPVAEGEIVRLDAAPGTPPESLAALERVIDLRLAAGEGVLVRGRDGASGSATRMVRDAGERAALLAWAGSQTETCYLVDRLEDLLVSPNLLFFLPPAGEPRFVAATDQILDAGLHHAGNSFPSRAVLLEEMIGHARALAAHLQGLGYQGWAGFDFCEFRDRRSGRRGLLFAELNARVNGACYPVVAAARLRRSGTEAGAFRSAYLRSSAGSFAAFARRFGEHLVPGAGFMGCLPFNIGCLPHGYCAVLTLDRDATAVQRRWQRLQAAAET